MMDTDMAIEQLLDTKSREAIMAEIDAYCGDFINWGNYTDYTTRQILEAVRRSDILAGEEFDGMLAGIWSSLI